MVHTWGEGKTREAVLVLTYLTLVRMYMSPVKQTQTRLGACLELVLSIIPPSGFDPIGRTTCMRYQIRDGCIMSIKPFWFKFVGVCSAGALLH